MKQLVLAAGIAAVALSAQAAPAVSGVSCAQAADGTVTVSYTLSGEAAIVTFDALTNGVPLGGEALWDVPNSSDCWKLVETGARTIVWRPHANLEEGSVTVRVNAWSADNPPPVMVADLQSLTASADRVRYYPSLDHLPGGLLGNAVYRTSKLVFRKVMAAGVDWKMGAPSTVANLPANERAFDVTLSRNYYLAVFEFTQGQYRNVVSSFQNGSFAVNRAMRPMEYVTFNEIRCSALGNTNFVGSGAFADAPYAGSLLDVIRTRTGVAVDLPTDAEWEFACKAGDDGSHWDNGALINLSNDNDSNMEGRHKYNGGFINGTTWPTVATCDVENGTDIVGSYAPNAWGFHDMHGNLFEFCLDWYESDPSSHAGAVNIDPNDPLKTLSGTAGTTRVRRGGGWNAGTRSATPTYRLGASTTDRSAMWGMRPLVAAGTATAEGPAAYADGSEVTLAAAGGRGDSSAGSLEARVLTWLESAAIAIKAEVARGLTVLIR